MRPYNPNASYDAFDFRPSTQTTNPSMSTTLYSHIILRLQQIQ
jgi:hypothetical protein